MRVASWRAWTVSSPPSPCLVFASGGGKMSRCCPRKLCIHMCIHTYGVGAAVSTYISTGRRERGIRACLSSTFPAMGETHVPGRQNWLRTKKHGLGRPKDCSDSVQRILIQAPPCQTRGDAGSRGFQKPLRPQNRPLASFVVVLCGEPSAEHRVYIHITG